MKNYEQIADSIIRKHDERLAGRKRRNAMILRSFAIGVGAAAVLGIGITTYALRPPKKPAPSRSGIIVETETASAETTMAQPSPSTTASQTVTTAQTTTATATVTASSALPTTTTVRTTANTARTTRTAVGTTVLQTTAATTAVSTTSAISLTTAAATQTTATSSQTTTQITYVTTVFVPPFTWQTGTTSTSENTYNGRNYTSVRVGNSSTEYVKVNSRWDTIDVYIKTALIYDLNAKSAGSETGQLYTLAGVSDKYAVVIRYPSTGATPVYLKTDYEPDTLGDMLDDMLLSRYMTFGSNSARVLNEDGYRDVSDGIWDVLEDCRSAVNTREKPSAFTRDLTVYANIEYIDYGLELVISEQGYISTNIIDRGATFYIGEEKAKSCIEYLLGT